MRTEHEKAKLVETWSDVGELTWFDVTDTLGPDAEPFIQLTRPDGVILYQGVDGDRFAGFTHGFGWGTDYVVEDGRCVHAKEISAA